MPVLVAEDNPDNTELLQVALDELGYRAEFVEDGEQVLQATGQDECSAIVMDMQMPVMDGLAASRAIRESESTSHRIPIIALTANAMDGDREKCLTGDYTSKPFTVEQLSAVLGRWIRP
ncbi:MAG: response regulator [Gammaproteobacteria bacterium]|nr:response regulator [Gammaproteobacteria bacterium]